MRQSQGRGSILSKEQSNWLNESLRRVPTYSQEYVQFRRDLLLISCTPNLTMQRILLKNATGWTGDSYALVQRQEELDAASANV